MEQVREAGEDPMTPRQKARKAGAKQYEGSPCKRCGGTTRYTSGGACTACVKATAALWYDRLPREERNRRSAEWHGRRLQFGRDYGQMTLIIDAGGIDAYLAKLDKARQEARSRYVEGQKAADSRLARATRRLVPGGRGEARHRAEHEEELKRLDKELEREYKRLDGWEKRARAYYLEKGCGTRT